MNKQYMSDVGGKAHKQTQGLMEIQYMVKVTSQTARVKREVLRNGAGTTRQPFGKRGFGFISYIIHKNRLQMGQGSKCKK